MFASAEPMSLPYLDRSVDIVAIPEGNEQALQEARRVLRPGGKLLFLEHVRSDDPKLARFQDRITGLSRALMGCDCNRSTLAGIEDAGFTVSHVEQTTLPKAPKFVRPLIIGAANA